MRDDDQPLTLSVTEGEAPVLPDGMVWIFPAECEPIAKDGGRLFETNSMLGLVPSILFRIPLKFHVRRVYLGRLTDCGSAAAGRAQNVQVV